MLKRKNRLKKRDHGLLQSPGLQYFTASLLQKGMQERKNTTTTMRGLLRISNILRDLQMTLELLDRVE